VTERRIRDASSPALANAAVDFKSGSLWKCSRPGACGEYRGAAKELSGRTPGPRHTHPEADGGAETLRPAAATLSVDSLI